jgi:hypothetical protein
LRSALESLRASLDATFVREGASCFTDPWAARDAYGRAMTLDARDRLVLLAPVLLPGLDAPSQVRALELLELARDALRMFTSCAWFFDDITGLEVAQNLRYAARAIDLAGPAGLPMETELLAALQLARSSDPGTDSARDVWLRDVRESVPSRHRLAGAAAAAHRFVPGWQPTPTPAFEIVVAAETVSLVHRRTGRTSQFRVTVAASGVAGVDATVEELSGVSGRDGDQHAAVRVPFDQFTERERLVIEHAIRAPRRRDLAHRLLDDATLAAVATGGTTLVDAVVAALLVSVSHLARDSSAVHVARVEDLLDLLDLIGRAPPFDAQTAFADAMTRLAPGARSTCVALAARLGFASSFLDSLGGAIGGSLT